LKLFDLFETDKKEKVFYCLIYLKLIKKKKYFIIPIRVDL